VPAKLAARAQVLRHRVGPQDRAADAHSIVMVTLRDKGLRELSFDSELLVLRLLRPPR
jgi:hypothetical protein